MKRLTGVTVLIAGIGRSGAFRDERRRGGGGVAGTPGRASIVVVATIVATMWAFVVLRRIDWL